MSTTDLFTAYEVEMGKAGGGVPAFFIESTAPDNLDQDDTGELPVPPGCSRLPSVEQAVDRIASLLAQEATPKLVVTVHGFNTPRPAALKRFTQSFATVNEDHAIGSRGVVCVGYRWPSEHMLAPWLSGWSAAPAFLLGLLLVGLLLVYLVNFVFDLCSASIAVRMLFTAAAAFMAIIPITLFLLRLIVYFRDQYRATTYGVPDLVDLVRLLDGALSEKIKDNSKRVDLCFIGHSMGGFVVTNTVRILSDVFSPSAPGPKTQAVGATPVESGKLLRRSEIGKAFLLRRLVLVSPDIPAEVLMSGRANALRSSVERFQEAHLFSNEADEVLRNISTTANFFALPTRHRRFGFRLGNVGVLKPWGISVGFNLGDLRVGARTLGQLFTELGADQFQPSTAQRFTYFDCTDSIDGDQGLVSSATRGTPADLSITGHLRLLGRYLLSQRDVHSGYFDSRFLASLIYRMACIGYADSEQAYGSATDFDTVCKEHQIRAVRHKSG